MSQKAIKHCSRMQTVVNQLEENGEMKTSELADEMGIPKRDVRKTIRSLRNRGRVESEQKDTQEKTHWLVGGIENELARVPREVYSYLKEHGDSTGEEIAEGLGIAENSVRQASVQLEDKGLIETRPNPLDPRGIIRSLSDEGV